MCKKLSLFLSLLCLAQFAQATTYYVANDGNDSNNGLSATTPWQTIAKVNSVSFANNDVILFKRGHVFRGSIASKGYPLGLRFDSYGTGDNPVIAGSVKITGWKPSALGINIYEADVSPFITTDSQGVQSKIDNLFVNRQPMTVARYPNVASPDKTNWLNVDASAGTDAFTDSALTTYKNSLDYWKGATLRIRTYSWLYKVFPITGYSNGKITAAGLGAQLPQWGFFIDGKKEELDYPGEWFYDASVKKVYFYPPAGIDPNTALIEGSTYKTGLSIYWHEDNTVAQNLTFRHFINAGVEVNTSNNVTVQNCQFEYNMTGITTWNPVNLLVSGNTFTQQLDNGILLNAASGFNVGTSVVEKNTLTNTAMIPLYCKRYSGICNATGLSVFGKAFTIRKNILNATGWTGIYLKADGAHTVENNVVRNALSLLNDGGAISIGSSGNTIRGNFLLNSVGNVDSSNGCGNTSTIPCFKHSSYGMGLGSDSNYTNITVDSNVIANNNNWGIRFNAFTNSKITNNLLFNNSSHVVLQDTSGVSSNNTVSGNTLYSVAPPQLAVLMTNATEHGLLSSNFYCNPYSGILFNRNNQNYSFAHWISKFTTQDTLSKQCTFTFPEYLTSLPGAEMFSNTSFTSSVTGWLGGVYDAATAGMTGGSLKYSYNAATNTAPTVSYSNLPLTAGKFYRLRFSIKGSTFGNVELRINDATDYSILQSRFFPYFPTAKSYEYVFQSPRTTAKGMVALLSRNYDAPNYWLDDVSLVPVTAQPATKPAQLFMNATAAATTTTLVGSYVDLYNNPVGTTLTLNPYTAKILIQK